MVLTDRQSDSIRIPSIFLNLCQEAQKISQVCGYIEEIQLESKRTLSNHSLIDSGLILLNICISSCDAFDVSTKQQTFLLAILNHFLEISINSQLNNSRDLRKSIFRTHLGDTRNLTSLIYVFQ